MNRCPIVLLDFAKQLRTHSFNLPRDEEARIRAESYDEGLIASLVESGAVVILFSTRPGRWAALTMDTIRAKTGWRPAAAYFNDQLQEPAELKSRLLLHFVIPGHGEPTPGKYLAIEDEPRSVAMYAGHGIESTTFAQPNFLQLLTGGPRNAGKKKKA